MKIFISTEKNYEEVFHQEEKTVFLNSIIQQHKRDNPSKTDYTGDLQPTEIIKLMHFHQVQLYTLFDLFFHDKECMRNLTFERIVKLRSTRIPKKVFKLCEFYDVICKEAPNKSVSVEVPAQLSRRRGRNFKALKTIIYV